MNQMLHIKIELKGVMEERKRTLLHELAVEGNATSLLRLLEEDSSVLDGCGTGCFEETPLHISAMLGHLEFTRKILIQKPELATELDFRRSTPLHLATANGHLEVVKALLSVDHEMCLAEDCDGLNPLHIAVIRGRVDVLKDLVRTKPEAALIRTEQSETILHLCAKHSQLDALRFLVLTNKDYGFINSKDNDGSTVLHLAVAYGEIEIINFLLMKTTIEVNAINTNGFTALDIALNLGRPRNLKDVDIRDSLNQAGALSAMRTAELHSDHHITALHARSKRKHQRQNQRLAEKRNAKMIVASLIATMTFQAGINPPSDVWQSDMQEPMSNPHEAGNSILADNLPHVYNIFVTHNTTAFLASLSVILLLISGLPFKWRFSMWVLMVILWVAIVESSFTYLTAIYALSSRHQRKTFDVTLIVLVMVTYGSLGVVLVGHAVRLIPKIVKFARRLWTPTPRDRSIQL